jgi:hypothetical protein
MKTTGAAGSVDRPMPSVYGIPSNIRVGDQVWPILGTQLAIPQAYEGVKPSAIGAEGLMELSQVNGMSVASLTGFSTWQRRASTKDWNSHDADSGRDFQKSFPLKGPVLASFRN